jgi:hypothetical protein
MSSSAVAMKTTGEVESSFIGGSVKISSKDLSTKKGKFLIIIFQFKKILTHIIFFYHFFSIVLFDGVEFDNMGQRDVNQAGLDFRSVSRIPADDLDRSYLLNSVMHDCIGLCFRSDNSKGWEVKNSVFLKAHTIHMHIGNSTDYVINSNAFIGALERNRTAEATVYDTKAFIYVYTSFNP